MGKANNTQTKKLPSWFGGAVAGVVALAVVLISIYTALAGSGFFVRHNTVAESDDYSLSETELSYLTMMQYQTFYNNYYYYIAYPSYFGNVLSLNPSAMDDTIKGADAGYTADPDFDGTWREYFIDQSKKQAQYILGCLQLAKKEDIDTTLTDDQKDAIDNAIAQIESGYESYISQYCSAYGVSAMVAKNNLPLSSYYASNYGTGVKESDVRSLLKKYYMATTVANEKGEALSDALKTEEVDAYLKENTNDYLYADYLYNKITYTENAIDRENETYGYKVACEKIDALVKSLADAKTEDEFKDQLGSYLAWAAQAKFYYDYINTAMKNVKDDTATEDVNEYDEALKKAKTEAIADVETKLTAAIKTEYDAAIKEIEGEPTEAQKETIRKQSIAKHYKPTCTTQEDATYSKTSSEINDWIFGNADKDKLAEGVEKCEPAKKGDIHCTEAAATTGTTSDKLKTYAFTAYYLTEEAKIKTDMTNNVAYVAFENEADAKAFLEAVKANASATASGKAFKEFGDTKKPYASVFYKNMKTEAFSDDKKVVDEWLANKDTKVGDLTILTMNFTSTTGEAVTDKESETYYPVTSYYCVFFYVSEGETYAQADARANLTSENLEKWYNGVKVTFTNGIFEKLFSQNPGTSAPATSAATSASTGTAETTAATTEKETEAATK